MNYKHKYKIKTIDFYVLSVLLLLTTCSHLIVTKIFSIENIPIIASSITYMGVISITSFVRAYSSKANAFKFIVIETVYMFCLLTIGFLLTSLNSPTYLKNPEFDLHNLFYVTFKIYGSNLIGIFVMLTTDLFLFSILYSNFFVKNSISIRFFFSSLISSLTVISLYTYVTDYLFFGDIYHQYWISITNYNILSNIVFILMYSIIFSNILKIVKKYINDQIKIGENFD